MEIISMLMIVTTITMWVRQLFQLFVHDKSKYPIAQLIAVVVWIAHVFFTTWYVLDAIDAGPRAFIDWCIVVLPSAVHVVIMTCGTSEHEQSVTPKDKHDRMAALINYIGLFVAILYLGATVILCMNFRMGGIG